MWPRRKKIRALVFDVGGVLVTTRLERFLKIGSLLFGCAESVLNSHIAPLIEELERGEIDSYALWEELGTTLESKGLGRAQDPEKAEVVWTKALDSSLILVPEMLEICRQMEGKIPMAVLSNTIDEHAQILRSRGVYASFNPCVLSCEVGLRKPDARIYQLTCELLNTPPEHCLFIDDLPENIKGAKACRMQTHHFVGVAGLRKRLGELGLVGG